MVAPRADRIEVGLQFGVVQIVQLGGDALAAQLGLPMRVQHLHHSQADRDRVRAAPGLRAIAEQPELRRQRGLMLRDEKIHAARVIVKASAVGGGQVGVDAPGRIPDLQNPLRPVVLELRGAEDLRQLAIGVAAKEVHLPEPVLRRHVALRHKEIVLSRRVDVRHAVRVAADGHRCREPGHVQIAIQRRQRGDRRRAQPQHAR